MLYNFLWDDVARKQLQLSKQTQNHSPEAMELVGSPTTALPRPVSSYESHVLRDAKRNSTSSKMNFRFPFTAGPLGSHSPALSQEPSLRFSHATNSRLTM
jgi:hypothetical protein